MFKHVRFIAICTYMLYILKTMLYLFLLDYLVALFWYFIFKYWNSLDFQSLFHGLFICLPTDRHLGSFLSG